VKRFMLALAAITLFLTITSLPSMADGDPTPIPLICTLLGCSGAPTK
jgi:hypothetical protein